MADLSVGGIPVVMLALCRLLLSMCHVSVLDFSVKTS